MKQNSRNSVTKKLFYTFTILFIAVLVAVGFYAYSILNNPDVITLGIGEEYTLTPREDEFLVRSYNADIITPCSGSTVKATNLGDAVVCVKYNYFDRDFYRFVVVDAPKSITLSKTQLTLGVGENYTLNAQSLTQSHKFNATYTSSNESIATVSESGKITALKHGKCIITATVYNGLSTKCELSVKNAPTKLKFNQSSVTLGEGESISLDPIFAGGEYSTAVELVSSDTNVAVVNGTTVTANSEGECVVTATAHNGVSAECTVTVKKMAQSVNLTVLSEYDLDAPVRVLTSVPKGSAAHNIELSVSDEEVLSFDDKNKHILHPLKKGECTITATLSNGVTASKTVTIGDFDKSSMSFKILNQFPSLPTGCEVVSLTSVLNHYGENISMNTMAEKYMPMKKYDYYSVSPHDYFLGTPYSFESGMGCFSGCIVKTANNYFNDKNIDDYIAVDITGCSTDELYNFLYNRVPVITWVTSGFVTPTNDGTWNVNDETVTWCNHEHCLVTTSFDKNAGTVTVADDSGGYSYTVSMSQYEKVFKGMGSMAVVILKK